MMNNNAMKDDVDGKRGQLLLHNIINFDSNEKYNSSYHYCDNITTNQSFFYLSSS